MPLKLTNQPTNQSIRFLFILFSLFTEYYWEIVNILIYLIKYSKMKIFFVKTYNKTSSFKLVQARYQGKLSFNTIPNRGQLFKLVKNFGGHGICEDRRETGSSPIVIEKIQAIIQEKCARDINNFAWYIQ